MIIKIQRNSQHSNHDFCDKLSLHIFAFGSSLLLEVVDSIKNRVLLFSLRVRLCHYLGSLFQDYQVEGWKSGWLLFIDTGWHVYVAFAELYHIYEFNLNKYYNNAFS